MKRIIVVLICMTLLTGCKIDIDTNPSSNNDKTNKVQDTGASDTLTSDAYIRVKNDIKVFSKTKLVDVIDTNVEISDTSLYLDTDTIGENTIVVSYKYKKKDYKYNLKYNVIDTTSPIYLSAPSTVYLKLNDKSNPCDDINMADNYTKEPTCEIVGDYDITKTGTYYVKYVIKDESNNKTEKSLTLNVGKTAPSSPDPGPTTPSPPVQFEWVMNKFKQDNTEFGIDVSRWQGDIDFEKVKNAGATFVMMRMGVSNDPTDELGEDSKFRQNISRAKAAGLKVGVYIYTAAINDEMAVELANFAVETLGEETVDYPIVFDWENWSDFRSYKISIHDLNKTFITFANELKKHNLDAMLYGSKYYLEIMWNEDIKNDYPVWLAHYTNSKSSYEGKYMMWQMCSDGRIDGIDGDVDIDILYK